MNKFILIIFSAAVIISLNACTTQNNSGNKTGNIPAGDNSMNSLDWQGAYIGTLPCADCEGIRTILILKEDLSFNLRTKYLGKSETVFESKGTIAWNEEGNTITLNEPDANKMPVMYFVGEDILYQLDPDGNKITGESSGRYILKKSKGKITGNYWKLVELNGRKITTDDSFLTEPHFMFYEDNTFTGNGACNKFSGSFTLLEENGLTISDAAITEMACPQSELESEMLEMLNDIKGYMIDGENLLLFDSRKETIARFLVVYIF